MGTASDSTTDAVSAERRPRSATAAAVSAAVVGLFLLVTIAPGAVAFLLQPDPPPVRVDSAQPDTIGPPASWVFAHPVKMMAFHGLLGLATLIGGICVWFRRRWARRPTQLSLAVVVLLWVAYPLLTAVSFEPLPFPGPLAVAIRLFFGAAALAVGAVWASLTAVPIWLLERPAAKHWLAEGAA